MGDPSLFMTRGGQSDVKVFFVHDSIHSRAEGDGRHLSAQQRFAKPGWQPIVPDQSGYVRSLSLGWPNGTEVGCRVVAAFLGDSSHLIGHIVKSSLHLPQLVSNELNTASATFMTQNEPARRWSFDPVRYLIGRTSYKDNPPSYCLTFRFHN